MHARNEKRKKMPKQNRKDIFGTKQKATEKRRNEIGTEVKNVGQVVAIERDFTWFGSFTIFIQIPIFMSSFYSCWTVDALIFFFYGFDVIPGLRHRPIITNCHRLRWNRDYSCLWFNRKTLLIVLVVNTNEFDEIKSN